MLKLNEVQYIMCADEVGSIFGSVHTQDKSFIAFTARLLPSSGSKSSLKTFMSTFHVCMLAVLHVCYR